MISNPRQFLIRRALIEDALGIHQAHMESIQKVCSQDHSPEEIKVWGHRAFKEDQRINAITNQIVYVVVINDKIEGYAHLKFYFDNENKKAHIMGLYLTPKAQGLGIGKSLLINLLTEAKKNHVVEVTLESTLNAKSFYLKNNFKDSGEIKTMILDNQPIRCIPMSFAI